MSRTALFKVDVQVGFCPGGNLAVPDADQIIPYINALPKYDIEIDSADWHPPGHKSFASAHQGKKPFIDAVPLNGAEQRLWPSHCVANTPDANFAPGIRKGDFIVHKGMDEGVENYSPFFANIPGHPKQGEILDAKRQVQPFDTLQDFLRANEVQNIDVCGLATDYCVKAFVLDALKHGFSVRLLTQGCRGVNVAPMDSANAIGEMYMAGAETVVK
jgi:nicotinamidase/pyrazinamidase